MSWWSLRNNRLKYKTSGKPRISEIHLNSIKKIGRCQHINGWTWEHWDLNQLCPKSLWTLELFIKLSKWNLGLSPKITSSWKSTTKSPKFSQCLNHLTPIVVSWLIKKTSFLACPYRDEWTKVAFNNWSRSWTTNPTCKPYIDPKILSMFEEWKKKVPKISPTFGIGSDTQRANELELDSQNGPRNDARRGREKNRSNFPYWHRIPWRSTLKFNMSEWIESLGRTSLNLFFRATSFTKGKPSAWNLFIIHYHK